jgi:hypothetical protein
MFKTEESKVGIMVILTWLFYMPIVTVKLFNEFAIWALAIEGLVVLGMLISILIGRKSSALKGLTKDERTERFSLKASRNGFLMTVVLTTLLAADAMIRGWHIETIDLLIWIWMWATGTYGLSYLYYVMRS